MVSIPLRRRAGTVAKPARRRTPLGPTLGMSIQVTGGAGYIGSYTVRLPLESGREVVTFDSLEFEHRSAVGDGARHDWSVSEFLVLYLDSIDERLLDYLDEDDEPRPEVVKRLRYYASALLEGSITPAAVAEDWADWFDLVLALVAAYAPGGIEKLEEAAPLISDEVEEDTMLTAADRAYLTAVELLLDAYPEMRLGE